MKLNRAYLSGSPQANLNRFAAQSEAARLGLAANGNNNSLDEYPFATTLEGGGYALLAPQVLYVPGIENSRQGGLISAFLSRKPKRSVRAVLSCIGSIRIAMSTAAYKTQQIVQQLDLYGGRAGVPFFDSGGCYPIECRLTGYGDHQYWGITLEEVIFSPRAGGERKGGHLGIRTNVYSYGNGMRIKLGGRNSQGFTFSSNSSEGETFCFEDFPPDSALPPQAVWEHVNPNVKTMRIRDQIIPIETDPSAYEEMGIELLDPPRIKGHELLRGLPLKYRKMLFTTEEERLGKFLKKARPPMIIQLDEWYHPKMSSGERPGQTQTFQMLAEVLVTGDASRYRPTVLPNTHWSNWPGAGNFERPVGW